MCFDKSGRPVAVNNRKGLFMSEPTAANDATLSDIRSQFAGDPEFRLLLDMFVDELGNRVDAITSAWRTRQIEQLTLLVRQLKGAGGGYGLPKMTESARELEQAVIDRQGDDEVERLLDALTNVCDAVIASRAA